MNLGMAIILAFAGDLIYVRVALPNPAKSSSKQSKLRISYGKNNHKFK